MSDSRDLRDAPAVFGVKPDEQNRRQFSCLGRKLWHLVWGAGLHRDPLLAHALLTLGFALFEHAGATQEQVREVCEDNIRQLPRTQ